jgi:peptide/nickel transport system permease protein
MLYGLRVSLYVGFSSTVISAIFGTLMGLMAGYLGGKTDALIMRIADIQLSFPAILIALVIMSLWGQGLFKIIIAISVVNWVFTPGPPGAAPWPSGKRTTWTLPGRWE